MLRTLGGHGGPEISPPCPFQSITTHLKPSSPTQSPLNPSQDLHIHLRSLIIHFRPSTHTLKALHTHLRHSMSILAPSHSSLAFYTYCSSRNLLNTILIYKSSYTHFLAFYGFQNILPVFQTGFTNLVEMITYCGMIFIIENEKV